MTIERTLSIIKPDAVEKNIIGLILSCFEENGLKIVAAKMIHLTKLQAEKFYDIHKKKPFYIDLIAFMISGPVLVQVLEGDNAIAVNRKIIGATDPAKANSGTIRAKYATSIDRNIIHGSDTFDTALSEIKFFFNPNEIHSKYFKADLIN
ncbi:MAG: nucleoside-diphosphate kinase [Coxiellaceae bacterium]|jgi:nucleoside-diphosphate kinase|nr:nucleoside-diphosphate kinase [Coxiellaceae bacterium]